MKETEHSSCAPYLPSHHPLLDQLSGMLTCHPRLEVVGPEQLSGVVLDLAEGYAHLPSGLRPNCRVIVDELLPALEELTRTPKCTWCLYPSPSCACGSIQAQAQCRVRSPPEDLSPPYQREAPTTIGSTPQLTTGTLSSHAQAPGRAYFQQGITYPMPILGVPEDPPPMWMPIAAEHGLRPTIEPRSQSTVTTTQRAVPSMPPLPGLTPPATAIPALMSLMPTSGPTPSVTSTRTTRTRDTTASIGPSASSSSQRESRCCGQARIQGFTQVGSSQTGTQQSSQSGRRRRAQSQGRSQSQTHPPSQSQSQRQTQTTTTSEGDRQARAPANPSSSSSAAQQTSTQGDVHQETPMDTSEACPWDGATLADKWGEPYPFKDEGPDMPKSEGWKADYSTFFRYFLRGHYPQIPPALLRAIYEPVLRYLGTRREFWARLKEEDPLQLMPYLASVFERQTTLTLPALAKYEKWIKVGSFYHTLILQCEELNHTPHLATAQVPNMNQRSPNEDALISHHQEYKATLQQADTSLATLAKAQMNLLTSLVICRKDTREVKALSLPEPLQVQQPQSGAGDATLGATSDAPPPPPSNRVPTTSKRQKR